MDLPAPDPSPPLRLAHLPLPPYRYLPGRHPHPTRHPHGHSRGAEELSDEEARLRGMDLFDHRFYWEAHEAWETVWKRLPRDSAEAELLQGLIQVAASFVQRQLGSRGGSARLLARGTGRIRSAIAKAGPHLNGLDLPDTIEQIERCHASGGFPLLR